MPSRPSPCSCPRCWHGIRPDDTDVLEFATPHGDTNVLPFWIHRTCPAQAMQEAPVERAYRRT